MSSIHDTQPNVPVQPQPATDTPGGPGCVAWGLLTVAASACSLIAVLVAGLGGYLTGQTEVETLLDGTKQAQINQYLSDVPTRVAEGNTAYIEGYIDWFGELTPAPTELAGLVATGTQLAQDIQPTATATATATIPVTETLPPTAAATSTTAPTLASASAADDADAPLFDAAALFQEAEAQIADGELDEAVKTLVAVQGVDPTFRPQEVQDLIFQTLRRQAEQLLRSGDPATLSVGIVKANEAERYGNIGELSYERYIAELYINAQSNEATNPQAAIEGYGTIYTQAPSYLDVRSKLYNLRVELGDAYLVSLDYCPAVTQYQAALQLVNAPEIETKLQTAEASCTDPSVVGDTVAPGAAPASTSEGATPSTEGESATAVPTASDGGGVSPIGERP